MTTLFLSNLACNKHINPIGHPEQVARLVTIENIIKTSDFKKLKRVEARLGSYDDILEVHSKSYLKEILDKCSSIAQIFIDADTVVNRDSLPAALYGVGAVTQAIDLVTDSTFTNAFCATRPPGHHAEKETAMGFCIFGNVAIGAKYALKKEKINKVAILDFDVHHGNGTQNLLWDEKDILFISSHQMPLFPGSGNKDETGAFNNIFNLPLLEGSDGNSYLELMDTKIIPRIENFNPDLIMISAGFDAHVNDPLANLNWVSEDYYRITKKLCVLAEKICQKRIVSSLEGGYNLSALGDSVAQHVRALMEE